MAIETKDIPVRGKQEATVTKEPTFAGPVFSPAVDVFEDDNAIVIVADMPGVSSETVNIDLRDDVLTITGVPVVSDRPEEEFLLKEYETGKFFRQFSLSETIDQGRISATLHQGVLRLTLPKVGPAKPRKIPVQEA
ncbi:MAG: Hsp20/alpha crystallin family protein [Nitrospirae bacterium]|nr:MAG: Hsp20/alpha crystallin family protein [Nitrospirota bacterium]